MESQRKQSTDMLGAFSFTSEKFNRAFCLMIAEDRCPNCKMKNKGSTYLKECQHIWHMLVVPTEMKIQLELICPMCGSSKRDVKGWIDNLELPNNMSRFACPNEWHTPRPTGSIELEAAANGFSSKIVGNTLVISGLENCTICGSTDKKVRNPVATPFRVTAGDAHCHSEWHCTCAYKFYVQAFGHAHECPLKYRIGIDKAKEGADVSVTNTTANYFENKFICSNIWHTQKSKANSKCPTCGGEHKYPADERIKVSQKFEVGDVVRIKSGSPEMTIANFMDENEKLAWVTYFEKRDDRSVKWIHTELVSTSVLVRVQSGPVGPT